MLLVAAICAACLAGEARVAQAAHKAAPAWGSQQVGAARVTHAMRARLLARLSLGRRQVLRSPVRLLFASVLGVPEAVACAPAPFKARAAGTPAAETRAAGRAPDPYSSRPPPVLV